MGCHPSHWRTHIFQLGGSTTNQYTLHLKFGATKSPNESWLQRKASSVAGEAESFLPGTIGSSPTARRPGTMSANGWEEQKTDQKWVWWSFDMLTLVDTLIYFCSILLCWIFVLPNWKPFGGLKCTEIIQYGSYSCRSWVYAANSFEKACVAMSGERFPQVSNSIHQQILVVVWNIFYFSIHWD